MHAHGVRNGTPEAVTRLPPDEQVQLKTHTAKIGELTGLLGEGRLVNPRRGSGGGWERALRRGLN